MEGITTAIVAFFLLCIAFPRMVRNRTQFYAAFVVILAIILLHSVAVFGSPNFAAFLAGLAGLLQVVALTLLVLAAGGLSLHELTGEVTNAFEVIRRGETEKTVIIPQGRKDAAEEPPRERIVLDEPGSPAAAPQQPRKSDPGGPIPLE